MTRTRVVGAIVIVLGLLSAGASPARAVPLDRAVVRFVTLETGGVTSPRFIFERELAFEARLEALSEAGYSVDAAPYRGRHVRAALERHVAETLLESLPIHPEPTEEALFAQVQAVRVALLQRVGGAQVLGQAAEAEGIAPSEILRLLRRQARASLYLDRMVAPMLDPSEAELRRAHANTLTPFAEHPFSEVKDAMRRWYVSRELSEALENFYEGARARLRLELL